MLFTSFSFLIFAALTLLFYFLLPRRVQWVILLVSSLIFYLLSGWQYFGFLLYTAAVTYVTAVLLQKRSDAEDAFVELHRATMEKAERKAFRAAEKKKRFRILLAGLFLGFGMLAVLKYTAFVLSGVKSFLGLFGAGRFSVPSLLLPLGISFYTFQSMGYLIDVYRKKARAEKNPAKLLLFVSYFPQLLQGPISRFGDLEEQLTAPHAFDGIAFRSGLLRVMWGYFKKLVMADTAMIAIRTLIVGAEQYRGTYVVLLILLYSVQIYGDFTGGIDITIGLSEMMGIRLRENFDRPFSSRSVKEYWNRWHITMGTWFTDYVFYPLSVSGPMQKLSQSGCRRLGRAVGMRLPVYISTIVTWFLTGLWHGAGWNFIVWGLLNCALILLSRELEPLWNRFHHAAPRLCASRGWGVFQATRTFLLMGWIRSLDCYRDVPLTFSLWGSIFTTPNIGEVLGGGFLRLGLDLTDYGVLFGAILTVFLVTRLGKERSLRSRIAPRPVAACLCVCLLAVTVLLFGSYGIGYDASQFIYTQF